jgi:hypothetical protein
LTSQRPQLSGTYAVWRGGSYYAVPADNTVYLYTSNSDLPDGFTPSNFFRFRGRRQVPVSEVDRLTELISTCRYRGEPFEISNVIGDTAYLWYRGRDHDGVGKWDGMERTDKYDIEGEAPLAELYDFQETETEIPLPGREKT